MTQDRTNFGTKLGMVLATAGSAVGLGNVWRFPYMAGQNGGAVFILIYIFCVFLLGVPCIISEFIVGRSAQSNSARAFRKFAGKTPWALIGYAGALYVALSHAVGLARRYAVERGGDGADVGA